MTAARNRVRGFSLSAPALAAAPAWLSAEGLLPGGGVGR
jgi:hypothetical protein